MSPTDCVFLDAGLFIGALLADDPRHAEARGIVEAAREGRFTACTSVGVLAEVYAALTWVGALPPQLPAEAAAAVRALAALPSAIVILDTALPAGLRMLELAARHGLTARRIHDARHAATALVCGVYRVFTYDIEDWRIFSPDGIVIAGPPSVLQLPTH
ncbi:type II toxin-antitoxin system VapC family toxin [uncultured Thiodictyon sp.]|jgi:predicted nucleic acid-binding protein|uniref:type II toxin-antitoxin system VapC family toxin n=1 Tax=uncultured Thiodictyon sp. TaxID=1846217 RepID=UPI0025EA1C1C|nr:type II toxin-antitoxin system VapC family toxin [uncultured Thiodictyon sp.]